MKFQMGQLVATPAAVQAMAETGELPVTFLHRHARGDWGDLSNDDKRANERALTDKSRIFSAYHLKNGTKIWIITEAEGDDGQRASTCVMLPDDY